MVPRLLCPWLTLGLVVCLLVPVHGWIEDPPKPNEPSKTSDSKPQDLGGRLIRKAVTDQDEDLMEEIARLMGTVADQLEIEFDAGPDTQQTQTQILKQLDLAIEKSASRTRSRKQSAKTTPSDRRSAQRPQDKSAAKPRDAGDKGQDSSENLGSGKLKTGPSTSNSDGGAMLESRRAWGHLPERDRDEMIQGLGEVHIDRYKEWIEKYYRALQEHDE